MLFIGSDFFAKLPNITPVDRLRIEVPLWKKVEHEFDAAITSDNVDLAFQIWSSTAEQVLIQLSVNQGHIVSRKQIGRGSVPKVIQQPLEAAIAHPETGAATHRMSALLKLQRRIKQLGKNFTYAPLRIFGSPSVDFSRTAFKKQLAQVDV